MARTGAAAIFREASEKQRKRYLKPRQRKDGKTAGGEAFSAHRAYAEGMATEALRKAKKKARERSMKLMEIPSPLGKAPRPPRRRK